MIACLQKNFFLTGEENCSLYWIVGIMVLAHLRWGMLCVLLGVYDTLVWDRILQHGGRGLLRVLLLCLLRGRLRWGGGKAPRVFQPFEISDMGEMVGVMTEHTTKRTRVDSLNSIPPLAFVFIAPLGVLAPMVQVPPSGWMLWGLIPALTRIYAVIPIPSFPPVVVRRVS